MQFSKSVFFLISICTRLAFSQENAGLEPDDFHSALRAVDYAQLVDLRSMDEFAKGHIRNAVCFPYLDEEFKSRALAHLDKDKPLFLYCFTGEMSSHAVVFMHDLGFGQVYYLVGGFSQWTSKSKPYVSSGLSGRAIAAFTMDNLRSTVAKNSRVLLFLSRPNCHACQAMEPILRQNTGRENYTRLLKVNGQKDLEITQHFKPTQWPTLILFENGKQVWRNSGEIETGRLLGILNP